MTCREFKHSAASLSLLELTQTQDGRILGHAVACRSCESWLQKQRSLAASLHTLRARTAGVEAGPAVEGAIVQAFRTTVAPAGGVVNEGSEKMRPIATVSAPFAWRLSRLFEIGAYAAVAAAIAVAIFLGVHLLQHGSQRAPVQSLSMPERTGPTIQQPVVVAGDSARAASVARADHRRSARRALAPEGTSAAVQQSQGTIAEADTDDSQADVDPGYLALIICDPLSCSTETQVVRMELPAPASSQGAEPELADLIVGYDGVVRAVRLVN